jgi:hypothetical protein
MKLDLRNGIAAVALGYARRDVVDAYRRRTARPAYTLKLAEANRLSREYLATHPELIAKAREVCAKILSDAQAHKARKSRPSHVQNIRFVGALAEFESELIRVCTRDGRQ